MNDANKTHALSILLSPLLLSLTHTLMAQDTDPRFLIHQTTQMYLGEPIHFQAVQMNKSVFVWAGKQQANMKDLSIAMPAFGSQVSQDENDIHYIKIIPSPIQQ